MSDLYSEWLVKRKTPALYNGLRVICMVVTVVLAFFGVMGMPVFLIAAVILGVIEYFVFRGIDLEYEYLYVNGELDIDKIMSQTKRKKVISMDLTKMEILAPTGSHHLDSYMNIKCKELDFTSNDPEKQTYTMIYRGDKEQLRIRIEPNDVILNGIRSISPRKVILQ